MRIETPYRLVSHTTLPPLTLIMLKQPWHWPWPRSKSGKLRLLFVVFVSALFVHYLFGAKVYHVDYNVIQYYMDSRPVTAAVDKQLAPSATNNVVQGDALAVVNVSKGGAVKLDAPTAIAKILLAATIISNLTIPVTSTNSTSGAISNPIPTSKRSETDNVTMTGQDDNMTTCPVVPPVLVGPIKVWLDYPSFDKLRELYPSLEPGGHSKPASCRSRHRVAVIIPYRDRERHLRGFLHNMHALLTKQQLDYAIFVVEQVPNQTFNRAKLMNIGFVEASKVYDWQCFVFHDVDLLPEDDRNIYSCPEQPRHMSVAVDKFKYKLPYGDLFGGISAITREQFVSMNGFSNDYWGWGGEDDDMASRVKLAHFRISRYPANIARYKMIKHGTDRANPINKCRHKLMYKTKTRYQHDGVSSLEYKRISRAFHHTYTRVTVDLLEEQSRKHLKHIISC